MYHQRLQWLLQVVQKLELGPDGEVEFEIEGEEEIEVTPMMGELNHSSGW